MIPVESGREVLQVEWLPGSDLLLGTCHCGATHVAEGPIEVWEWLLGHPVGHVAPGPGAPDPGATPYPAASYDPAAATSFDPAAASGAAAPSTAGAAR
jgi:hypothetical protein